MQKLIDAIADMAEEQVYELTKQYLENGTQPKEIFTAFQKAMEEVGRRYEAGTYFVPELIMAGEMMKVGSEIIQPYLGSGEGEQKSDRIGRFLIATIEGDIHDIGKNIVAMLMDLSGFEVLDLGVDVSPDTIIAEAAEFKADIIGVSGLLTLAFDPMKALVDKLKDAGLRDKYKVIIGGAQIDENVCQYVGADAFSTDAITGISYCKEWVAA